MSKKSVIVVEDEQDMAELIGQRLRREGYNVALVHDGLEALEKIRAEPPDLVVLDIMLPRMSGTEILRELRADPRTSGLSVVMLTAKSEETDQIVGLQLGADDYITKPFSMSVLVARLGTLMRRTATPTDGGKLLTIGDIQIDPQQHAVLIEGKPAAMTRTEFRLLLALAAARGRVLSRNQLIDQTIGLDAVVTDRTIDVHLTSLRRKLGKARDYIKTVRGIGYRLSLEDHEST
jgi:DNA-binding response OmpR family regulator